MTNKHNENKHSENKNTQATKKPSMTKRMLMTLCICGGVLIGAGGTAGIAAAAHHDDFRVAATQKKAKLSDIKIDQPAAIDKFNQTYEGKQISEVNLEVEHGKYVYEVKGFDDNQEYEVTINAKTGKVMAHEAEKRDQTDQEYQLNLDNTISRDEASKIAEGAAKKGTSREWQLKQEKNQAVWEVNVVNGHQVKEVTINANSKEVLKTEIDH